MNKLTDLFVKTVGQRTTELGTEIFQLKQRLQKKYPQLNFVNQSRLNKCEIIFCEMTARDVCHFVNAGSCTETETGDTDTPITAPFPKEHKHII